MFRNDVIELTNGKKLIISPVDASRLIIDASNIAFVTSIKDEEGDIKSVSFEESQSISLGDQVEVLVGAVKSIYNVKGILVSNDKKTVVLISDFANKTTTFLLPLLGKNKNSLRFDTYFTNAFIDQSMCYMGLMYRFTGTNLYKEFEESLMKDRLFMKHVEYDPYHTIYIFKISDIYENDVKLFFEGKYSEFSKELKTRIVMFHTAVKDSYVYQVIYKSEVLRKLIEKDLGVSLPEESELTSKPKIEEETFIIK